MIERINERSLLHISDLSDFRATDIMSSGDGSIAKISTLDTSVYYTEILVNMLENEDNIYLEIFELFEKFLSGKFSNLQTFEEKQNFLNPLTI